MNIELNEQYWNNRYQTQETGWDVKAPSEPLVKYINGLLNHNAKILIPGCGNAHEAEYLWDRGFTNITLLDIAALPVQRLQQKYEGSSIKVLHKNFFDEHDQYDIILEQTFFCALDVELRPNYVAHTKKLLSPCGTLAGVLFNRTFDAPIPPYGGSIEEYRTLFEPHFKIFHLDPCYNSIPPRRDTEVFIEMTPR